MFKNNILEKRKQIGQLLPIFLQVNLGLKHQFSQSKTPKATMLQIQALGLLARYPNSSAKELGGYLYLSSSATTQLLDRLFQENLIVRESDNEDRRMVKLSISTKGKEMLQRFGKGKAKKLIGLFSVLSEKELASFHIVLTKLNTEMRKQK